MGLNILWHSTVPWGGSSYSMLTKRTVPELLKLGHNVTISTWWGLQGAPQHANFVEDDKKHTALVLPSNHPGSYGLDVVLPACKMFEIDVVITCMDVWVMTPDVMSKTPFFAPWFPIDHDPAPKPVLKALEASDFSMVYSKWGAEVLAKSGVNARYIPCSAPTNIYKPADKAIARARIGVPDDVFLFSMVAANKDQMDRKGFSPGIQAFAKFAEGKDDVRLYIHTNWGGVIEIPDLCAACGIHGKVIQPNAHAMQFQMYTDQDMVDIYNATDVLFNPAMSEGFGLPIVEAQMCGVPVIATDFSTTDELVFAGWKVPGQKQWSFGARSFRIMPDIDKMAEALETAYQTMQGERARKDLAQKARAGATAFDTKIIGQQYWKPAIEEIESLVGGRGKLKMVTF